jgi:renalase
MPPARVLVVGAGVSGVACARVLTDAGIEVTVRDRGRVVGGRAASRTLHGRRVDFGASYLTARDPGFSTVVQDWVRRGLAHTWTDRFAVAGPDGWSTTRAGPVRFGTPGGIRTLVEDLAGDLDVRTGTSVGAVTDGPAVDGEPYDAVVLAVPDPQAAPLLDPSLAVERDAVSGRAWEPVLALAAGFPRRPWDDDGRFRDGCFVDPAGPAGDVLGWIADDGRRRGDGAAVLVAHSTAGFARRHLAQPGAAVPELVAALRCLLDLPAPEWTAVHRWSLARPAEPREQSFHLGDAGVGLCGDGWGSPRFETAWVSGTRLGEELRRRLA